ncbi:MAG: FAD-dependent oxidoreductase [Planctomycetes bacterium]|nr:FAD-dependent oxidoreductase [Planctomycetota bacterium]
MPMEKPMEKRWICSECGYVHTGPEPPDVCPICGASREHFTLAPEVQDDAAQGSAPRAEGRPARILVIGGGAAGVEAAQAAREVDDGAEIVLLSREAELPYFRLNLTRYLSGEVEAAGLPIHPRAWYEERRIEVILDCEATDIDREKGTVRVADGRTFPYDRLVLACGAQPFVPPIPGADLPGVFPVRERRDADAILAWATRTEKVVVIGGGILGIETAAALRRRGLAPTVIETGDWILRRQLDGDAARILTGHLGEIGIATRTGRTVAGIEGDAAVRDVILSDGERIEAGLVIISAGIRANTALAARAGLGADRFIETDAYLRTEDPAILAAGDVAIADGRAYGIWPAAVLEGRVAGGNAAGASMRFGPLAMNNTLKIVDVPIFSVGQVTPSPEDGAIEIRDAGGGKYRKLVVRDGKLAGGIFVGDTAAGPSVKEAIEAGTPVGDVGGDATVGRILAAIEAEGNPEG